MCKGRGGQNICRRGLAGTGLRFLPSRLMPPHTLPVIIHLGERAPRRPHEHCIDVHVPRRPGCNFPTSMSLRIALRMSQGARSAIRISPEAGNPDFPVCAVLLPGRRRVVPAVSFHQALQPDRFARHMRPRTKRHFPGRPLGAIAEVDASSLRTGIHPAREAVASFKTRP